MRYREIIEAGRSAEKAAMRAMCDKVRAVYAQHLWPEVSNPNAAERAGMPHEIECPGLTVHDLGQAFAEEFQGRRLWCRENCRSAFSVEPIWCATQRRDIGRLFRFSSQTDAALFRLHCC